ncbi:MAG: hypothetical protein WAQ33_17235 [Gaiellaceae bacterium]
MELEEAFRRIVGQHWRLIVCFAVFGLAVAPFIHLRADTSYTASARLVLDTSDPKSRTEAAAIADTAQAIATSPAQVEAALRRIGVKRDSLNVANHDVTVRPLGTSGVLQLSVKDRNAQAAAAIANSLATQVISARLDINSGALQGALATIRKQIDDLGGGTSAFDVQQRSALEAERANLLSNAAFRPRPTVISPATVPRHADTLRWLPDLTLGAILGLILGVGISGLLELIRPTLVGEDVLAREFDTPLLGRLQGDPSNASTVDSMWLSERIRFAVEAAGVTSVRLLGAGPPADLESLAASLTVHARPGVGAGNGDASEAKGESATPAKPRGSRRERAVGIDVFDLRKWSSNGGGTGLVLVSPNALKKSHLEDANRLMGISGAPVVGLITYEGRDRPPGQRQLDEVVSQARTWSRTHLKHRPPE